MDFPAILSECASPPLESRPSEVLISAKDDAQAILVWLAEHADSTNTLSSYRKEAERFLLWLRSRGLGLNSFSREDVLDYRRFLANPPEHWVGRRRKRTHPEWRPFAGPLKAGSIQAANDVLLAMMRYLVDSGYAKRNPFALKKLRIRKESSSIEYYLTKTQVNVLFDSLNAMPTTTHLQREHAARSKWVFKLLYLSGLRREEAVTVTMADFWEKNGRWWLSVLGKGNKRADIPIPEALISELMVFRQHLGLPQMPGRHESGIPLIPKIRRTPQSQKIASMSCNALHRIVKQCVENAVAYALEHGDEESALVIKSMSTHWLRHTSASHQLDAGMPLDIVSKNLRHSKLQTTKRYLHREMDAWHDHANKFGS